MLINRAGFLVPIRAESRKLISQDLSGAALISADYHCAGVANIFKILFKMTECSYGKYSVHSSTLFLVLFKGNEVPIKLNPFEIMQKKFQIELEFIVAEAENV